MVDRGVRRTRSDRLPRLRFSGTRSRSTRPSEVPAGSRARVRHPPWCLVPALLLAVLPAACGRPAPHEVRVHCAASLAEVVTELGRRFTAEGGAPVTVHAAGSSLLARQIVEGAPADLFVSASVAWADRVEEAGLAAPGGRFDLAGNRLVCVVPDSDGSAPADLRGLADPALRRIALGDPGHVPAGIHARQAMEHAGIWDDVRPRVVACDSVRIALAHAVRGEVDAAVVYATDVRGEPGVRIAFEIPRDAHEPVRCPALLLSAAGDDARAFHLFLRTEETAAALREAGFERP